MATLLIALGAFVGYVIAYHTYGRWLARRLFALDPHAPVPSVELNDDRDYVPTSKSVVFGHHFTSIAGTGPIVGPAIAIMWGWLPALLWVVFGAIFIGAVHDFGALVVSLRNRGQTVGDIAGRVLNPRVRFLFLLVLLFGLWIVLAIFGLVIANVFQMFPESILPVFLQIPIAVWIGLAIHRKGKNLLWASALALGLMYLTVWFGAECPGLEWTGGWLGSAIHGVNQTLSEWPIWIWAAVLLAYCYVASVLPVWVLLQPRDYINSLQLISSLGLIVLALVVVGTLGVPASGASAGGERAALEIVAPAVQLHPANAPPILPVLFITIACGAISGFHCLVSSGTSSKQLKCETDAQFVGYGSMLTESFLAVLVILAVAAGIGLGWPNHPSEEFRTLAGADLWNRIYADWKAADAGLGVKIGAFVVGSANFLAGIGIDATMATAIMGVLVASFAGTTLDTATRLQRYVVQELAATFAPQVSPSALAAEGYDTEFQAGTMRRSISLNPLVWLTNKHGATLFAVVTALLLALPPASAHVSLGEALRGEVPAEAAAQALAANIPAAHVEAMQSGGLAGAWSWMHAYAGRGGLLLWPMFGATNQLLAGLAFLVIAFWLWRRNKPVWFVAVPTVFMLVMPAWAMLVQVGDWAAEGKLLLVFIAAATLLLEAWMIVEAALMWPRVRGVLEAALQPLKSRSPQAGPSAVAATPSAGGRAG
ncbi:MAG TPA: carbon starvation protein A [Planctomycetaceae bacterium]|nr:carbon starvation protein A [Planctomycetaceae bacterium]